MQQGLVRLPHELQELHFLGKQRIFETVGDKEDFRHENDEEEDMRDVELPDAPENAGAAHERPRSRMARP